MNESTATAPVERRRRRRWPLVLAVLIGIVVVIVALAPSLLGGTVAGMVAKGFGEDRQGKLEVAKLDLAWFSRQRLEGARLVDPEGREVARADVELPSLWRLATGGGRKVGKVVVTASADLVEEDDGTTNLERALAKRGGEVEPEKEEEKGEPTDLGELLRELDLELEARVERAAWSDPRTRAAGKPFEIRDLVATVAAVPEQPIRVNVDGTLSGEQPGRIQVAAALHDLLDEDGIDPDARFELQAALDSLPSALVDALAGQDGLVAAALGPTFRVTANGAGTIQDGKLDLAVTGDRGTIEFSGQLAGGVLTGTRDPALGVALRPERALLERYVRSSLPEGLAVEPIGDARVDLTLGALRVEVAKILEALDAGGDAAAAAAGASELSIALRTNDWRLSGEQLPIAGGVELRGVAVDATLAPAGEARALDTKLGAELGAGASGRIDGNIRCDDLAALAAYGPANLFEGTSGEEPKFDATLAASGIGTAVLDAFAPDLGASRLVGPTLDVRVDATNREKTRVARIAARSAALELDAAAWIARGVVVCPADHALVLRAKPDAAALRSLLAGKLPEGSELRLGDSVRLTVANTLKVPLEALKGADPAMAVLRAVDAELSASLDRVEYQSASLAAAGKSLALKDVALEAHVSHEDNPGQLGATVTATIDDPLGSRMRLHAGYPGMGALATIESPLDLPLARVEVDVPRVPVPLLEALLGSGDGALVQRLGGALGVKLELDLAQATGGALTGELDARIPLERGESRVTASVSVDDPFQRRAARPAGALPRSSAKFNVQGLQVIEAFLPADAAASVLELVGDAASGELVNAPAEGSKGIEDTELRLSIDAARLDVSSSARIEGGRLRIAREPLDVEVRPTPEMLARHLGPKLASGAQVAFVESEPVVRLQVPELDLPLASWLPAAGQEPAPLGETLRATSARVALGLPAIRYTQPALDGGAAVPVSIEGLAVEAVLAAGKPATAQIRGSVAGEAGGKIALDAKADDVGAFVDRPEGAPMPGVSVTGELKGMPTGLVDALAAQDGLLVDVLGSTIDLDVSGSVPSAPETPLKLDLASPKAKLDLVARLEEGRIEARGNEGLEASLPLSPLFSKQIVGALVPLVVDASKPPDAAPVGLVVKDFTLPLDKDLRKLDADVRLDLGTVAYQFLPGLSGMLETVGLKEAGQRITELEPIEIKIVDGVARYDRLPVAVGDRKLAFRGKFDLTTKEFDLKADVPLEMLGKKISSELERAREFLDPKTAVPIELRGTWSKPKIGVGKEFLEKAVEGAAEGLLKKGLEDLLGGDKKRKKD